MSRVKKQQTVYGPLMEYIAETAFMLCRSKRIPLRSGRAIETERLLSYGRLAGSGYELLTRTN